MGEMLGMFDILDACISRNGSGGLDIIIQIKGTSVRGFWYCEPIPDEYPGPEPRNYWGVR